MNRSVNPWRVLAVFAWPLFVVSALCALDRWWWPFEDLASFRVQISIVALPITVAYLIGRRWKTAAVGVVGLAFHALALAPLAPGRPDGGGGGERLRVVLFNVHTENDGKDGIARWLGEADADAVAVLEVDDEWAGALGGLRASHPHGTTAARPDNFGIALLSRRPVEECRCAYFGGAGVPSIVARMGRLTIVATHPLPPVSDENVRSRDDQVADVARFVSGLGGPAVVLGDLNMTPWAPTFRRFLRDSGLRDSAEGFGWQPTWPADTPQMWIPLDHVLVSPGIRVVDRRVEDPLGSDHHPVIVDLELD